MKEHGPAPGDVTPGLMRAALQTGPGRMSVAAHPVPRCGPEEVLVRIERAAICGSDLHSIYDGLGYLNADCPEPGRPGHEAIGHVVESRSTSLSVGQRVLALGFGSFAEYAVMPASLCVALPREVAPERLVIAQQLGVVLYGLQRFWPAMEGGEAVTVIGTGPIGFLFASLARRAGFGKVIVSDIDPARVATTARYASADVAVASGENSVVEATLDATGGAGADLVIEAAGADSARADAISCVRTGGRVGLFGYPEALGLTPFPYAEAFWKSPITIEVVSKAQAVPGLASFHQAIRMIAESQLDIEPLTQTCFPLEQIGEALDHARDRRSMKVQLDMGLDGRPARRREA